jgi:hypothetical protein
MRSTSVPCSHVYHGSHIKVAADKPAGPEVRFTLLDGIYMILVLVEAGRGVSLALIPAVTG